jgi:hypothetical protein
MKVRLLRNIGKQDFLHLGISSGNRTDLKERAEVTVDDELGKKLLEQGIAEPLSGHALDGPKFTDQGAIVEEGQRSESAPEEEEDSEVANLSVQDASTKIAGMRKKEKVQHILDTDQRQGVKDAARRRLGELG